MADGKAYIRIPYTVTPGSLFLYTCTRLGGGLSPKSDPYERKYGGKADGTRWLVGAEIPFASLAGAVAHLI